MEEELLQFQAFDQLCGIQDASKKWVAFFDLMQRPWFSRRWVVQEIGLARNAIIYCGADEMSWKDFAIAMELLVEIETKTHQVSETMKNDPEFRHISDLNGVFFASGARLLVEETLHFFRAIQTFDNDKWKPREQIKRPLLSLEYLVTSLSTFNVTVEHDAI